MENDIFESYIKSEEVFEFKMAEDKNKPAIWIKLKEKQVIVNPLELYNILHNYESDNFFSYGIKAKFYIFHDIVSCSFQDYYCGYYNIDFKRCGFLESAIQSLTELCNAVLGDVVVFYKEFKKETAGKMLEGLEDLIIPKNYYQIQENEIKVERFSFNFTEAYSCDTPYVIKIGNKEFESALTDWSTDFNRIRLELENVIKTWFGNSIVNLHYEDSPTIIRFIRPNIFDANYRTIKKELLEVIVEPNEFIHIPNIYAYCDSRQLISSLYLGLLGICIRKSDWFDKDSFYPDDYWNMFRLATYNKLQSCVIENYINGIEEEEDTYLPRQRVINSVEEMEKDYQNLLDTLAL